MRAEQRVVSKHGVLHWSLGFLAVVQGVRADTRERRHVQLPDGALLSIKSSRSYVRKASERRQNALQLDRPCREKALVVVDNWVDLQRA